MRPWMPPAPSIRPGAALRARSRPGTGFADAPADAAGAPARAGCPRTRARTVLASFQRCRPTSSMSVWPSERRRPANAAGAAARAEPPPAAPPPSVRPGEMRPLPPVQQVPMPGPRRAAADGRSASRAAASRTAASRTAASRTTASRTATHRATPRAGSVPSRPPRIEQRPEPIRPEPLRPGACYVPSRCGPSRTRYRS